MGKRPTGAELLRGELEARGWKQLQLCQEIDASPSAVSRWLSGGRVPDREMALALERALGIPAGIWDEDERRRAKRTGTDG